MPAPKHEQVPIRTEEDVVRVRQLVRQRTQELRFNLVEQTKIVTAASELARNTLIHGGGGTLEIELLANASRAGLRLTFADQGPGISDLSLALTDGYSTGGGLGLGLSGAKRLMSEFSVETTVGQGTRVTVARWK